MCTAPNTVQHEAFTVFEHTVIQNIATFKEDLDGDILNLSLSLDELFAGYLNSELSECSEVPNIDRFRDYLKLKELLRIIE